MRTHTSNILLVIFIPFFLQPAARASDLQCAARSDVVASCFKLHGALRLYNGTPSARIMIIGSKRILGVTPYFANNNETFVAPAQVRDLASFDSDLIGTFLVCPLSTPKAGEMQEVCIEAATSLKNQKRKNSK